MGTRGALERLIVMGLMLVAGTAWANHAPMTEFFPLQADNRWSYTDANGSQGNFAGSLVVKNFTGVSGSIAVGNNLAPETLKYYTNDSNGLRLHGLDEPNLGNFTFNPPIKFANAVPQVSALGSSQNGTVSGTVNCGGNNVSVTVSYSASHAVLSHGPLTVQGQYYPDTVTIRNRLTVSGSVPACGGSFTLTDDADNSYARYIGPIKVVAAGTTLEMTQSTQQVLLVENDNVTVNEDAGTASIAIRRLGGQFGNVSVQCFTESMGSTATENSDYTPVNSLVQWSTFGTATQNCTVPITDDLIVENDETIKVSLSNPTNNYGNLIVPDDGPFAITVTDNDVADARHDFNGDGISDILLQANDGLISIWLMNSNGTRNSTSTVGYPPAGATIQGAGDFNNDGTADVLLLRPDGLVFIWLIDSGSRSSTTTVGYLSGGANIEGIGDFNNDGTDDILLRRADGLAFIWLINNGARSSFSSLGYPPSTATIKGIGDFNNDGTEDIVFRRSDGLGFIWLINDGVRSSFTSLGFPPATASIAGVGDFNGNGSDDLFFQRNDGLTFIWMIDNGVRTSYTAPGFVSTTSSVEAVGSHNGDSTDDILFFRDDGLTYIWMMENGLRTTTTLPGYR